MRAPPLVLLVALLALLLARAARAGATEADDESGAATLVALLPSVGPAADAARRDIDAGLRKALLQEESVDLLAPVETRQHVMSLAELGLVCLPDDIPCLAKLGIVANVAWVLVPVVIALGADTFEVRIDLIDVAASSRARSVKGRVGRDDDRATASLVRRALDLPPRAEDPDGPADPVDGPTDRGAAGAASAALPLGVIVAAAGGAVAGLSLVGAVVCDLVYTDALDVADKDTRRDVIQPLGATLWATTLVGAVAAGAGAALILTTPEDGGGAPLDGAR